MITLFLYNKLIILLKNIKYIVHINKINKLIYRNNYNTMIKYRDIQF